MNSLYYPWMITRKNISYLTLEAEYMRGEFLDLGSNGTDFIAFYGSLFIYISELTETKWNV